MGLFDMFDKLDDIVYKPVETICNWVEEPLRRWDHGRNLASNEQNAQIDKEMRELDAQLEREREENAAKIRFQQQKWDVEINEMIAEQEAAHRDELVEAIKNYQIQLANASRDIVESIGEMSLRLRRKANDLIIEKTREYKKIQDEAKEQSRRELKEVKDEYFESDPDTYHILADEIMRERRNMVETAGKCITELSEDLKRLNENTDILMREGMKAVNDVLKPMAGAMGGNVKMLENQEIDQKQVIIEADYIEK